MKKAKLKSPAKINLTLEVVKKLPNGFHLIRSVMIKLENLNDEVEIYFNKNKGGIKIICDKKSVPTNEKNICWKIAEKFFQKTGKIVGLVIKIKKHIPVSAGLGGGSSNGAMVLVALNKYFNGILSEKKLVELAAAIGKDIPFFLLKSKTAYISGMGEKMKIIENFPCLNLVIINPKGEISTPWAYGELDRMLSFMKSKGRKNISQEMAKSAGSSENISHLLYNDFDLVAEKKYPEIPEIKKALIYLGASGASLSGKGPTVFGIFKTKKEALKAILILKKKYPKYFMEIG